MEECRSCTVPKREEINTKYKWKLEDIYEDLERWEEDFCKAKSLSKQIIKYKTTLGQSAQMLVECLNYCDNLLQLSEKVFMYAKMRRDEDNHETIYRSMVDKIFVLNAEVQSAISFTVPEIISIPEDTLNTFINNSKELQLYKQYIDEILRQKEHTLSEKEEKAIALFSEISNIPKDAFNAFNNADIKFSAIKDQDGEIIEVRNANYPKLLRSLDREVRQKAFQVFYKYYYEHKNTLATIFVGNTKKNKTYAIMRGFDSCLDASLFADNISSYIYDNLVETVNKNLNILHKYIKLRKKALRFSELHIYDLYVPIVELPNISITYEMAMHLIEKSLEPLGKEYIKYLQKCFNSRWIDVFENQYKTCGAYSWSAFNTHPYILLNYKETINDVLMLGHEIGHALHSLYTNAKQPYIYSKYKVFIGEVASTVNELLIMKYMLKACNSNNEKAHILNLYLDKFRGIVFRQIMFAEFEKIVHEKVWNGEALTAQVLCNIYYKINKKYLGEEIVVDKDIEIEWAAIPHFYNNFYVYKYAIGFLCAISISEQLLEGNQQYKERYIEFLSSGNSIYPLELLKEVGIDISTSKPIQDGLSSFAKILDELEELIRFT